jgi:hypothetical protein
MIIVQKIQKRTATDAFASAAVEPEPATTIS